MTTPPAVPSTVIQAPTASIADLTDLFRREYLSLVRLASLWVDDVETSEDVVQEAFAATNPSAVHRASLHLYVQTAVINRARSTLRRRISERRIGRRFRTLTWPLVRQESVEADTCINIAQLITRLPERQRDVLILRFYLDLSVTDTARRLGIREDAIRSSTYKAIRNLRNYLGSRDDN